MTHDPPHSTDVVAILRSGSGGVNRYTLTVLDRVQHADLDLRTQQPNGLKVGALI
jgi:hypothetical protein